MNIASRDRVNRIPEELVMELILFVFDFDLMFITDKSSLSDFDSQPNSSEYPARIRERFGVDVATLPDDRLVTILEAIMEKHALPPEE